MTTPFPEPDSPALERFAVYSRFEVIGLLRQLIEHGVLTNVYYDPSGKFFLTALLSVNPDFEELVVDAAPDEVVQRRLLESRRLTFVAFVGGVKLQFEAARAEATTFDGGPALRVRLPERVIRMQRREFFRVRPLASRPVTCRINDLPDEAGTTWQVLDISVGGLALACRGDKAPFVLGMDLTDCEIGFPGGATMAVGLRVCSIGPSTRSGEERIGCEFIHIAPQARLVLQRYINQVEAEQRKAVGGDRSAVEQ